jgi:hypothetical protein
MADLTGYASIFSGDTAIVDTTLKHALGTRARDVDGNEYIYVQGVTNGAAGSWVTLDEDHVTTLAVANGKGRVAILMAALDATTDYGWAQIYGKNTIALALTGFADNGAIYLTATAGSIDDADVGGDSVIGAVGRSEVSGGVITVELNYPFVDDIAHD